jgi:hypothetical protein
MSYRCAFGGFMDPIESAPLSGQNSGHKGGGAPPKETVDSLAWRSRETVTEATPDVLPDPQEPVAQMSYRCAVGSLFDPVELGPLPGQNGGHKGGGAPPKETVDSVAWRSRETVTEATPATPTVARMVMASILFIDVLLFSSREKFLS